MRTIKLTRGKTTVVDDDVYKWASKLKWCACKATHQKGFYAAGGTAPNRVILHREIMKVTGMDINVYHLNGDKLDNRRKNLSIERHSWLGKSGYLVVTLPRSHPFCCMTNHKSRSVYEHRLVMANHLGRPLEPTEHVHHLNGNKIDNRIENLEITTNQRHIWLHTKERQQFSKLQNRIFETELEKIAEQALL